MNITKCPICGRRMFDIEVEGEATIETKCQQCGNVVEVKAKRLRVGQATIVRKTVKYKRNK